MNRSDIFRPHEEVKEQGKSRWSDAVEDFFKQDRVALEAFPRDELGNPHLTEEQGINRLERAAELMGVTIERLKTYPADLESYEDANIRKDLSFDEDTQTDYGFPDDEYYYRLDKDDRTVLVQVRNGTNYLVDFFIDKKYFESSTSATLFETMLYLVDTPYGGYEAHREEE